MGIDKETSYPINCIRKDEEFWGCGWDCNKSNSTTTEEVTQIYRDGEIDLEAD